MDSAFAAALVPGPMRDRYGSEAIRTFAVSRSRVPADCHTFQKFSLKI